MLSKNFVYNKSREKLKNKIKNCVQDLYVKVIYLMFPMKSNLFHFPREDLQLLIYLLERIAFSCHPNLGPGSQKMNL